MSKNLNILYKSHSERELEKMWADRQLKDKKNSNRSLLKAISNLEYNEKINEIPLYSKQMYDSAKSKWVPFDIRGAHYIINNRDENLNMRISLPVPNEYGEIIMGWKSLDSSYLQESLKEKNTTSVANEWRDWIKMVEQDKQEYRNEERYNEIPGYQGRL
jgi:hypothetical protein